MPKEELPLTKFERILPLEELHNVELDNAYHNITCMENLLIISPTTQL